MVIKCKVKDFFSIIMPFLYVCIINNVRDMKIAIFQANTIDHRFDENLKRYDEILSQLETDTQLLVMPEMFSTGFTIDTNDAQTMSGSSLRWMKNKSIERGIAIAGSLFIEEDGKYYNRHFFMFPNGDYEYYDKKHLFCLSKEPELLTSGNSKKIVEYLGWKIALFTCYDLRFPLWCKNSYDGDYGYDISIFVASWPEVRSYAWRSLLAARAIENISYLVGVNRCGIDETGVSYSGDSVILNFKGETLVKVEPKKEEIAYHIIDKQSLIDFRNIFPVGRDWDTI